MAKTPGKRVITQQDNYFWLLLALLIFFFLGALAAQLGLEVLGRVMAISLTAIILVAVWSMEQDRFSFSFRAVLTFIFISVEASELLFARFNLSTLQLISILTFTVITIIMASRQVLLTGAVDSNKIIGAICIYLLMGIAWAEAYLLIERIFPGSIPALSGDIWRHHVEDALYFSYVTLTTLGYGDISPAEPFSRVVVYLEAIIGVFYMAIVVASLIGAHKSQAPPND